eukprot:666128-Rhodomonas_salina.1
MVGAQRPQPQPGLTIHLHSRSEMRCFTANRIREFDHGRDSRDNVSVYVAFVADVVLEGPHRSHRNLNVLGCFRSLSQSNAAATRCCASLQAMQPSKCANTVPSLTFQESNGLANFEQEFVDLKGDLKFSRHFWVQRFELRASQALALSLQRLYVVCRGFVHAEDCSMTDEDDMKLEGYIPDDITSQEEAVAVATSLDEANRVAATCCFSATFGADEDETDDDTEDMTTEEEGTWLSWTRAVDLTC